MRFAGLGACGLLLLLGPPARAEPPGTEGAPRAVAAPSEEPPLVTPRLAREAISAAFRAAGFAAARRTADGFALRARLAAVLPDLSVRVARSTDQSLRFSPTTDDPYRYSEAGGAGLWLEARATWHWDRLVFDRDELAAERLRIERADAAAKLQRRVLEELFSWQRAVLSSRDPAAPDEERAAAALRAAEAEVILDVLTGGWFVGERQRSPGAARP